MFLADMCRYSGWLHFHTPSLMAMQSLIDDVIRCYDVTRKVRDDGYAQNRTSWICSPSQGFKQTLVDTCHIHDIFHDAVAHKRVIIMVSFRNGHFVAGTTTFALCND